MTSVGTKPASPPGPDRLEWTVARELSAAHKPTVEGWCATCRPLVRWECEPAKLASASLLVAVAEKVIRLAGSAAGDTSFDAGYRSACEDMLDAVMEG